MKSSWSADSAIPKFVFLIAPKDGFAKELVGFLARMIDGFEEVDPILPIPYGLIEGFDVADAVTLPSSSPSSLEMKSSMSCFKYIFVSASTTYFI